MSLQSGVSFYLIILVFALTPGPGIFALIARVMGSGFWVSIPLGLGMCLGDILYMLLVCFGLATLASTWGDAMLVVRYVGAIYLCYLGYKLWNAASSNQEIVADKQQLSHWASFLQGALISVSNPKVILFYVAFLPTIIKLDTLAGFEMALMTGIIILGVMTAICMVAYAAHSIKSKLQSSSAQTKLNRVSGSVMIGAGAYLALSR